MRCKENSQVKGRCFHRRRDCYCHRCWGGLLLHPARAPCLSRQRPPDVLCHVATRFALGIPVPRPPVARLACVRAVHVPLPLRSSAARSALLSASGRSAWLSVPSPGALETDTEVIKGVQATCLDTRVFSTWSPLVAIGVHTCPLLERPDLVAAQV